MKNWTNRMLMTAAAAALMTSSLAHAQSGMRVRVPFEFKVGDAMLPAGEYKISRMKMQGAMLLKIVGEGKSAAMKPIGGPMTVPEGSKPRMTFRCGTTGCAVDELWNSQNGFKFAMPHPTSSEGERMETVLLTGNGE